MYRVSGQYCRPLHKLWHPIGGNDHFFCLANSQLGNISYPSKNIIDPKVLKDILTIGEEAARIGGDEFIIFKEGNYTTEMICERASDILDCLHKASQFIQKQGGFSISMGIALANEREQDFDTLYSCADKALYHVKQNGKNGFHIYGTESSISDIGI